MLVSIAASSSAFWVSAGVTVAGLANLLVALTYVVQMVSKELNTLLVHSGFNLEIFVWGGMVLPHTMHGEYLVTCICICQ